jgi:hypothetical protein
MDHPVLGMVFSIGFTALLNSSGVAMTVYISLCKQGLLTQSAGVLPCRGGIPCRVHHHAGWDTVSGALSRATLSQQRCRRLRSGCAPVLVVRPSII